MEVPDRFHFTYERRVEFADTDLAGIVHFANFFRYVESAEHAFFRSLGYSVHVSHGHKQTGWPRVRVSGEFFRPARFEDRLKICLKIEKIGYSSFCYGYWVFGGDGGDGRRPIAAGRFTTLYVELDQGAGRMEKRPIPADLRKLLEQTMQNNAR